MPLLVKVATEHLSKMYEKGVNECAGCVAKQDSLLFCEGEKETE
jgi:hypothetical protein